MAGTKRVEPEGPKDAKIMFIGECPASNEVAQGRPFVGNAGKVLDSALADVGIKREDIYITNVMKVRAKNDDFSNFYDDVTWDKNRKGKTASDALLDGLNVLHNEIETVNPNLIVTLGGHPFSLLNGHMELRRQASRWVPKLPITSWRGSVVQCNGRKVLAALHPAGVARQWGWRPMLLADLARAKKEATFPELQQRVRDIVRVGSIQDAHEALDEIERCGVVSFDIEVASGQVNSIAMAVSPQKCYVFLMWFGEHGNVWPEDFEAILWHRLGKVLENPKVAKIIQNNQYDCAVLRDTLGINVKGILWDTMLMAHTLWPELPHGLDFLVSILTDHPYYKNMINTPNMEEFARYNGLDAVLTFECALALEKELKEAGQQKFYYGHVQKLFEPLLDVAAQGLEVDETERGRLRRQLTKEIKVAQEKLEAGVGHPLNVASNPQMCKWLYEELGLPLQKGKSGKPSADEDAISRIKVSANRPSDDIVALLDLVLEIRGNRKLLSTYVNIKKASDGKVHCSFNQAGTKTGRLSSHSYWDGSGGNMQNIPRKGIRQMFVPAPGNMFVEADLSQAEARVVACLTGDPGMLRAFASGGDVHKKNAAMLFGVPEDQVTGEQRTAAKASVHGGNYGMGAKKLAMEFGLPVDQADKIIKQYHSTYPGIKLWHSRVDQQVKNHALLMTPLGRRREFLDYYGGDTKGEAYAHVPQSTVGDFLNARLVVLWEKLRSEGLRAKIILQVHDSVLIECPKEEVKRVVGLARECLTAPIWVEGRELVIPVDVAVGENWGKETMKEVEDGKEVV